MTDPMHLNRQSGTAAERAALSPSSSANGLEFTETDTGDVYVWAGAWYRTHIGGAQRTSSMSSPTYPIQEQFPVRYSDTATALGTTDPINMYNGGVVDISAVNGDTVTINGLIGADFSIVVPDIPVYHIEAPLAVIAATGLGTGHYILLPEHFMYMKLQFVASGAVNLVTLDLHLFGGRG